MITIFQRWAQESGVSFQILPERQVGNILIGFVNALPGQTERGDVLAEAESPSPFPGQGPSSIEFDNRFSWVARFAPGQSGGHSVYCSRFSTTLHYLYDTLFITYIILYIHYLYDTLYITYIIVRCIDFIDL